MNPAISIETISSPEIGRNKEPGIEELQGPGFHFVRSFLLWIFLLVGFMLALACFLSWYFSMDVTVEGKGIIEPKHRHLIKSRITGIIKEIHVHSGQQVQSGDLLVTLDETDWRVELDKIGADIEINESRIEEIELQIQREYALRQAEVNLALLALEQAHSRLDRVLADQQIQSSASPFPRKPLEELFPVRSARTSYSQAEGDLKLARHRFHAVKGRKQEVRVLKKQREKLDRDRALLNYKLDRNKIRSSAAGIVLTGDLQQRIGDRLLTGETILEISEFGKWQAKIGIREMDLPRIEMGQPTRLYINAFPYMEYKVFEGNVAEIPSIPAMDSSQSGKAVYPVKISISDSSISESGRSLSLVCGMNVEGKIVVERGRIAELLWKKWMRMTGKVGWHDFHRENLIAEKVEIE